MGRKASIRVAIIFRYEIDSNEESSRQSFQLGTCRSHHNKHRVIAPFFTLSVNNMERVFRPSAFHHQLRVIYESPYPHRTIDIPSKLFNEPFY
jgi:hypothetical protein